MDPFWAGGPKWARRTHGPKWARARMGPYGPGRTWVHMGQGPGAHIGQGPWAHGPMGQGTQPSRPGCDAVGGGLRHPNTPAENS